VFVLAFFSLFFFFPPPFSHLACRSETRQINDPFQKGKARQASAGGYSFSHVVAPPFLFPSFLFSPFSFPNLLFGVIRRKVFPDRRRRANPTLCSAAELSGPLPSFFFFFLRRYPRLFPRCNRGNSFKRALQCLPFFLSFPFPPFFSFSLRLPPPASRATALFLKGIQKTKMATRAPFGGRRSSSPPSPFFFSFFFFPSLLIRGVNEVFFHGNEAPPGKRRRGKWEVSQIC